MAKKNTSGGGLIIVVIIIGMLIKYWQVVVTIGSVALVIWAIVRLMKGSSGAQTPISLHKTSSPANLPPSRSAEPSAHFQMPTLKIQVMTGSSGASSRDDYHSNSYVNMTNALKASPDSVWIPQGRTIEFQGYTVPGGLIYFGTGLSNLRGNGPEPALIDPAYKIEKNNPDKDGQNMNYWSSYDQSHPASRAAFLEWLSTGRKEPNANIGYVFMYFYGLERRALSDVKTSNTAKAEIDTILAEAKRLLAIYGDNRSFRGYCSSFIDLIQTSGATERLYKSPPSYTLPCYEIPSSIKVALGQLAADGMLLPPQWALAWVLTDPMTPRRTPMHRCREEFSKLFCLKYAEKYGEGSKLKLNKTKLKSSYRPASPTFNGAIGIPLDGIFDVTVLKEPINTLRIIADWCSNELDTYSRYLGRKNSDKNSIEATVLLPQVLLDMHDGKEYRTLSVWLQEQAFTELPVKVSFSQLLHHAPSIVRDSFGKREAITIAQIFSKLGVGMEPDPRFGSFIPKTDQDVILFKLSGTAPNSPSSVYASATVVLHLASAVACANGTIDPSEERLLQEHLETWLHLTSDEKARLRAHTQWLLSSFPGMNGVKKRIEVLKREQRESLGRFLVGVAQADGYIDPLEIKILTKIYEMLGLDSNSLYSHAHSAAIEPVTVQVPDFSRPRGYAIPAPPPKTSEGISLDMGSIQAKLAETVAVSAILHNIFTEDEPTIPHDAPSEPASSDTAIAGLDPESFAFMQALASKLMWARLELEQLASEHNLMLDGTLDSINDASFDHFGGPFFEGEDPIEIDAEFAKELAV